MKKVFLADDEILIRETLRECIPWEKEGFIYCGDAPDGEVALPLIEQLRPDILITDIKMPFMNGLELIEIVRKRFPAVKIIILSGYEEFEYARTALRLGVEEYCLKPVSSSDITQLLKRVSSKIDSEAAQQLRIQRLKQKEAEQHYDSEHKLLNDLCSGFITTAEALHLASSLAVDLAARYYAAAVLDIRGLETADPAASNALPALAPFAELQSLPRAHMFKRSRTETVWIIKANTEEELEESLAVFRELQLNADQQPPSSEASFAAGIGGKYHRLQGIHLSFLEALEDLYWRKLSKQNRRELWEASLGTLESSVFMDRGAFIDFLKVGAPAQLDAFVESYAGGLRELDWSTSMIGYYLLNDLTLEVFRTGKELCRNIETMDEKLHACQQAIGSIRSWEEVCHYLTELTRQFWSWRALSNDKYTDLLMQVKGLIHASYDRADFSLQDAASHVGVSQSHLSKVFSQETGQTFIEYLTQTRIQKAMELLLTTPNKTYEIAHRVGYHDAHYFSNLFKRVTGQTPKQFRLNRKLEKEGDVPV